MTTPARWLLAAGGALVALYGGWLLLSRGHALVDVVVWLAGGVLAHDILLSAVTLVVGATAVRVVPASARAPLTVGLIVLGSVSLLAIPVLGRFGARRDNPTLLDRNYVAGWCILLALTSIAVLVASLIRSRRR